MRSNYYSFLPILMCVTLSSAATEITPSQKVLLDQQLIKNSDRYGVVGQSVVILKNHKLLYKGQQGFANFELDVPIDNKHLFPSYSVTKLLTSVLMMQQVQDGRVKLNSSIRTYLPYLAQRWQTVTVEHLLSHTSGVPQYMKLAMANNRFLPTKKAVYESLVTQPDHFKMGTMNDYNNTNFLLLSSILESITGKSYQALVDQHIVKPLGLKNTGHASAKAIIKNMVTSYQGNNGIIKRNIDIDWPQYTFSHSALYTTPEDLTTFMTALVAGQFVSKSALMKFWQPMKLTNGKAGRYAFGFEYTFEDGYFQVGHDGGNRVKLRHYFKNDNSSDNYTIAYVTNGNAYDVWTDVLADSLMSIVSPKAFNLAGLKEQFMTAVLENNGEGLSALYDKLTVILAGDTSAIQQFLLYRSYALRYGSGAKSSIVAFEFLNKKFPNSANARQSLADAWAATGNKQKAIENYKMVLKITPNSKYAQKQIELLKD